MQKTLFLDAGNSRLKTASLDRGTWRTEGILRWDDPSLQKHLSELCGHFERVVLSSVKKTLQVSGLKEILANNGINGLEILGIDRESLPKERIDYRTPETLGVDRFMACLGAWSQSQNQTRSYKKDRNQDQSRNQWRKKKASLNRPPVIVTDAGTACTIDTMDADGIFQGGVIMPGLQMLAASLEEGADGLFQVTPTLPASWPPDSTEAAIQAGTTGTFLAAWESHVQQSIDLYPDAQIWVSGGDAEIIMDHTKRPCRFHGYLVFEGMREWLTCPE